MAAKKKATPGRKRGRPRKSSAPASSSSSSAPASSSSSVDALIAGATSAPAPDTDAALEALAAAVESEAPARAVVLTGDVHTGAPPGAGSSSSPSDVAQLSQQIAALAVVLFGVLALWRGDEWALEEDEAELLGDATAEPYADEAAELMAKVKWLGPATALVGIVGRKFMAETDRKKKEPAPRAPGTAPAL